MSISNRRAEVITSDSPVLLSVCVAVFNVRAYLADCLESMHAQTLTSVEFIIVDDGSTDGSLELARRYESQDARFRVIVHTTNKGSMVARKTAIEAANGKYVMFLDGDDRLACPESLSTALALIERAKVDILHFTSEVFDAPLPQRNGFLAWVNGGLDGLVLSASQYLGDIFLERTRGWTIWNKIYRTSVLKTAASHIPEERFISAEDAYLTFIFGYFATSFLSLKTPPLYTYRVGVGISTRLIELKNFQQYYVKEPHCCDWLEAFIRSQGDWLAYAPHVHALRRTLIRGCCDRLAALPEKDWAEALRALLAQNDLSDVAEGLASAFGSPERFGLQNIQRLGIKIVCSLKALRYLAKSRFAMSKNKRHHYRVKLWRFLISS